ncbi:RICIN domain-containing protein [Streptomyces sp. NBC_01304]|uniref:RICIN domain-containing protein n=1 Tax=Streptomyces sp. NBC_01304 TaxID=2903818 RepID=UPI002E132276|nr:RICIN domain-containing protein [Streptomyces sp. NBC_01304]
MIAMAPYARRAALAVLASLIAAGSAVSEASAFTASSSQSSASPAATQQDFIGMPLRIKHNADGRVLDKMPDRVALHAGHGGVNQQWTPLAAPGGSVLLEVEGRCLTYDQELDGTGRSLHHATCDSGDAKQQWKIANDKDGKFRIKNVARGDSESLMLWNDATGLLAMRKDADWKEHVFQFDIDVTPSLPEFGKNLTMTAIHSGKVVDMAPNPLGDSRNVIQFEATGGDNQAWKVERTGNGVQFKSKENDGCIKYFSNASDVYAGTCSEWGQFKLTSLGGDTYTVESNDQTGRVLTVPDNSMANGTKLELLPKTGGANQKFMIKDRPTMWEYSPGARLGIEGAPGADGTFESLIYNESAETYVRKSFNEKEHVNIDAPDEIEPGKVGILQVRSDTLFTGPEGSVTYRSSSGKEVKINWNLPTVGSNKYTVTTANVSVSARDQNDNRFHVPAGQSHYAEGSSFGPNKHVYTAFTINGSPLAGGPKPQRGGKCEAYASAVHPGFDWSIIAANLSDKQRAWLEALTNTTDKIEWAPNAPWWASADGQAGAVIGAAIGGIIAGCDPWT